MKLWLVRVGLLLSVFLGTPLVWAWPTFRSENADEERVADGDLDAEDLVGRGTVSGRGVGPSARGGTWISLEAFVRESAVAGRETGGLVVVGLPWERIAGPRRLPLREVSMASPAPVGEAGLTTRFARSAVEAAWRAASLGPGDARVDGMAARARWSAMLPETRLRATRTEDQRLSTDASLDASHLRDSTAANVGLEARLTWRLDRVIYADDEPSFERMRIERHDVRARIAGHVLEALFRWNRARVELASAGQGLRDGREGQIAPSREELEAVERIFEAEATLDVLTDGWFGLAKRKIAAPAGPNGLAPASHLL
jgi:hypothetical protein